VSFALRGNKTLLCRERRSGLKIGQLFSSSRHGLAHKNRARRSVAGRKRLRVTTVSSTWISLERQADVVFGQRRLRGLRRAKVVELGDLHPAPEIALFLEAVKQLGHPPGEALGLPHAGERPR